MKLLLYSLLRSSHNSASTTATRRWSGNARVCDDSVLTSCGSMHAYALNRKKTGINESHGHVHTCLTTEPVNVHNTMLALVFAVANVDLGGMFLRSTVSFVQHCMLLGVEEIH